MSRFNAVAVLSLLAALPALAQGFELDLTDDQPEKPATTPPELRPSIAVLAVTPADAEPATAGRARLLEAELSKLLAQGEQFNTVMETPLVASTLGADAAQAQACADWACLDALAKRLGVQRLLRLSVQKAGAGSEVTAVGYDAGFAEVLRLTQDSGEKAERGFVGMAGRSQAQRDKDFMKKMTPFLAGVLGQLATPNGTITVDSPDPGATATIDGAEAGTGSFDAVVQRGKHVVRVAMEGFEPFEETVTVEPLKTVAVAVKLQAKAIEAPAAAVTQQVEVSAPVLTRPGLYIAIAGAAAVGTGLFFGKMASDTQRKVEAGGNPVDLTRAQAKAAPTQALVANILVGVGAAMVAGGATWFFLTPTTMAAVEGGDGGDAATTGLMLTVGGSFDFVSGRR